MCNYADDIKTPLASLTKPTETASINPATSGVTAGSGPDMWEPVSLIALPSVLDAYPAATSLPHTAAFGAVLSDHSIGHKRIYLRDPVVNLTGRPLFVIKTSDVATLQALGDDILPADVWEVVANLDPSDYRGGGKARRRFWPSTADFDDDQSGLWLVERNAEWAAQRGEPYFLDVSANMGRGAAFVLLGDEATRKG